MKTTLVRLGLASLSLAILFFGLPQTVRYLSPASTAELAKKTGPLTEKAAHWREQIETLGGKTAYAKLLQESAGDTSSVQHMSGHIFGHELYETNGLEGFSVCGLELAGGCLHEFVSTAIQDMGLSSLFRLNLDCISHFPKDAAVTCQHGLGHGLISHFGYEYEDLVQALLVCATLPSKEPIKGCASGALMEYQVRTVSGAGLLPIGPKGPFETCEQLPPNHKPACYFWTPQFVWESLYGARQTTEAFVGTGSYCEKVPAAYVDYCFEGLGNFVPPNAAYEKAGAKALCDASSTLQHNRDTCWVEASRAFTD